MTEDTPTSTLADSIGSSLMAPRIFSAFSQSLRQSSTISSLARKAVASAAGVGSTTVVTASGFGSEGDLRLPRTS